MVAYFSLSKLAIIHSILNGLCRGVSQGAEWAARAGFDMASIRQSVGLKLEEFAGSWYNPALTHLGGVA
jgi:hypothetical protein